MSPVSKKSQMNQDVHQRIRPEMCLGCLMTNQLPIYVGNKDQLVRLSSEAELQFGGSMETLEKKLVDNLLLIAKVVGLTDITYTALNDYLRPQLATQALLDKS